ncbi:unnamed protein product [Pleuronectes platessa]|uniref:Uncharacterized protein n=1 Tax=Pleuronectes platessa TaxID=8262 RepID=A0A9N7V280_PLEPL|nr:unnamed protein product [Pleuronectes platessa]
MASSSCMCTWVYIHFLPLPSPDSKNKNRNVSFDFLGGIWLTNQPVAVRVAGSPAAVVLGCGGCGEIILGTAEWSRHQTHREEWITPTGRDSDKLEGWGLGALAQIRVLEKEQGYRRG